MATYWKSQPRKFCDYCKCWITDNKPSVEFHERGKNHQQNVKKRIDELKKKSMKDAADQAEQDEDMRKLEEAAIAAFKKDLIDDPELAARYRVRIKDTDKAPDKEETPVQYGPSLPENYEPPNTEECEWYEAKSDEGYTYYWSTETGASVWEKPEVYTSLNGEVINSTASEEPTDSTVNPEDLNTIPLPGDSDGDRVTPPCDIPLPPECQPAPVEEQIIYTSDNPDTSRAAYGQWACVVQKAIPQHVDLELPQQPVENIPLPPPTFTEEETKLKFKEKKVKSLAGASDGEPVAFKKRKITNRSRNTRKREDNDD